VRRGRQGFKDANLIKIAVDGLRQSLPAIIPNLRSFIYDPWPDGRESGLIEPFRNSGGRCAAGSPGQSKGPRRTRRGPRISPDIELSCQPPSGRLERTPHAMEPLAKSSLPAQVSRGDYLPSARRHVSSMPRYMTGAGCPGDHKNSPLITKDLASFTLTGRARVHAERPPGIRRPFKPVEVKDCDTFTLEGRCVRLLG
jgi:hypothetical protein